MSTFTENPFRFVETQEATAKLLSPGGRPVTVIGTEAIRATFDANCLKQITHIADAPGVEEVVLNPDGHVGYGCPVGSVFASREVLYPNAVGPDVKCSMSFVAFDVTAEALADKALRREIVNAVEDRIPTGPGGHMPKKARPFDDPELLKRVAIEGATRDVLDELGIPSEWATLCEDASHGDPRRLETRLNDLMARVPALGGKLRQLGGVGGGNHFIEGDEILVRPGQEGVADVLGFRSGRFGFLCHFGSRGFGFALTSGCKGWPGQFRLLADKFKEWHIPLPGGDAHNVYTPVGSREFDDYWDDMSLGANFATVNHLLVCAYLVEAVQQVLGDTAGGGLVYYIAHNIIRREVVDKAPTYVHRKGATRALPAGHHELEGTPFHQTGHPILLPGNPVDGSTIMVAGRGSRLALNSVNHGAGRTMSRGDARRTFRQRDVTALLDAADVVTNCGRNYPVDESPLAYKPYGDVIESVERAGLASVVARLRPVLNIKDNDTRAETSA